MTELQGQGCTFRGEIPARSKTAEPVSHPPSKLAHFQENDGWYRTHALAGSNGPCAPAAMAERISWAAYAGVGLRPSAFAPCLLHTGARNDQIPRQAKSLLLPHAWSAPVLRAHPHESAAELTSLRCHGTAGRKQVPIYTPLCTGRRCMLCKASHQMICNWYEYLPSVPSLAHGS